MTNGRLTAIHAMVRLLAVCDHVVSSVRAVDPLAAVRSPRLFPTAATAGLTRSGEAVGAGVELRDLRGEAFVGDGSGGGKAEGWLRVETMLARLLCMGGCEVRRSAGGICRSAKWPGCHGPSRSTSQWGPPFRSASCFAGEGFTPASGLALLIE